MFSENKYMSSSEMIKSNVFAHTCNKLSQLLKEKRSFIDRDIFSSCVSGNSMMNLLSKKEDDNDLKSLDLFPLMSSSTVVNTDGSTQNNTTHHKEVGGVATTNEEPKTKTESMTIFYGGRVLVFDDLTEDKAREIMSLASQGVLQTQTQTRTQVSTKTVMMDNEGSRIEQPSHHPILLDQVDSSSVLLPMAKRVSLHRFMEKRKNRIEASAPYPSQNTSRENSDEKYNVMMGHRPHKGVELKLFK